MSKLDTRDLETVLRQNLGMLEWQIHDLLSIFERFQAKAVLESQIAILKPLDEITDKLGDKYGVGCSYGHGAKSQLTTLEKEGT